MSFAACLIDDRVFDAQAMRSAGPELLSLALMDARTRTLGWLAAFEGLPQPEALPDLDPPWWLAGEAAWFQEYWIARHVQRGRGVAADPGGLRLASIEPRADAWFDPLVGSRAQRWRQPLPEASDLQAYLTATLETTLELLDKAAGDDDALHVFRAALQHEDQLGETLAVAVQALELAPERYAALQQSGLWPALPSRSRRDPLWFTGQTVRLGSASGGFVPEAEQGAHAVQLPEFEIDAQCVNWSQFAEFAGDGGYDERRWWTEAGWAMLAASGRRVPRYVEQMAGGVLARRLGRLQRLPLAQAVLHVTAHEAAAWCNWAGRRLPSEAEWTLAASTATARGFVWGEALEWVAGRAGPYPGAAGKSAESAAGGADGGPAWRILRGASVWASPRLRHAQARRFAPAEQDSLFVGFRSCAV